MPKRYILITGSTIIFLFILPIIFQLFILGNITFSVTQYSSPTSRYIHSDNSTEFKFYFSIEVNNNYDSVKSFSYDGSILPYAVIIHYAGKYQVTQNTVRVVMPYCCITTQIAKGKTFMIDYETVKVMNYHSTHLPGGTYSFSLDSSAFRNPNYHGIYKTSSIVVSSEE